MSKEEKRLGSYRLHKATGQAICWFDGKIYYLGKFDSEDSKDKYQRIKAEILTNTHFGLEPKRISVAEAVVKYLEYAKTYYNSGSEYKGLVDACKPLVELYPDLHLRDFKIPQFRACRDYWVGRGCARQYVNKQANRVLRIVKWWISQDWIAESTHHGLKCVEPLKAGRCESPEAKPVVPVSNADVELTIPHLPPVLQDMVRLHRLIACRPGEICSLKPAMIDTRGDVWAIRMVKHKNAWRGHDRIIYVGPQGQAILKPYLTKTADEYCFSPREAVKQRLSQREASRKTPLSCGNRRGSNRVKYPATIPGECYTTMSYGHAIAYACKKAKIAKWSPNQLRHSAATIIREMEGLESACLLLGHKSVDSTQLYAEISKARAMEVARKHG